MNKPDLTVVIGTRNRLPLLKKCIESLIADKVLSINVVVVDAGSTDGTIEYLKEAKSIQYVLEGEACGQAQSLNRVFRTITTAYCCWLSDDNEAIPGMLRMATDILRQEPDIGMVALKVQDVMGNREYSPYIGGLRLSGILTCNQGVLRTTVLKEVGCFDESFVDYGIDVDLTTKVLIHGYRVVFTKRIAIYHNRNHHDLPGAIDNAVRNSRIQRSYDLFSIKYPELEKCNLAGKAEFVFAMHFNKWMTIAIRRLRSKFPKLTEALLDCRNILCGRYVSNMDSIRNAGKPYYIDQNMKMTSYGRKIIKKYAISHTFMARKDQLDIRHYHPFGQLSSKVINDKRTYLRYDRLYTIYQCLMNLSQYDDVCIAEIGVYKGGGSYFIASVLNEMGKESMQLNCFDTFEGHNKEDIIAMYDNDTIHNPGKFNDTSFDEVRKYLGTFKNVTLYKGRIQDTATNVESKTFGMVHIDVDLYEPTLFSLNYFAESLIIGGAMIIDDFDCDTCPGTRKAFDEFVKINKNFTGLCLLTGQAVLIKIK